MGQESKKKFDNIFLIYPPRGQTRVLVSAGIRQSRCIQKLVYNVM